MMTNIGSIIFFSLLFSTVLSSDREEMENTAFVAAQRAFNENIKALNTIYERSPNFKISDPDFAGMRENRRYANDNLIVMAQTAISLDEAKQLEEAKQKLDAVDLVYNQRFIPKSEEARAEDTTQNAIKFLVAMDRSADINPAIEQAKEKAKRFADLRKRNLEKRSMFGKWKKAAASEKARKEAKKIDANLEPRANTSSAYNVFRENPYTTSGVAALIAALMTDELYHSYYKKEQSYLRWLLQKIRHSIPGGEKK